MAPSATETTQEYATSLSLKSCHQLPYDHHGVVKGNNVVDGKKELVGEALRRRVQSVDPDCCEPGEEDAFFVADLGEVYRQHLRWKRNLPRVRPHYAIKCNPDPRVVRLLANLGLGFDCASKAEIEQVLKLGVDPADIIYAQPCKTKSYVRFAAEKEVKQMTFDNAEELYKTKRFFPGAELFLRILTDDSASLCQLSLKFGASLDATQNLLELAKKLGLNVVGVAFHVGSGASDPKAFTRAVKDARVVFDQAERLGFKIHTLDVGGGFCSDASFETMAGVLSTALQAYFEPEVRIIGEPGRFYVSSAFTIACHVIARRAVPDLVRGTTAFMLYLNDGVYGNFSSIMFDHQQPTPKLLTSKSKFLHGRPASDEADCSEQAIEYSVWGPTCDGIDCIASSFVLSDVVDVGDWLYFEDMGAYTKCSATQFNGFTNQHDTVYVCSEPHVQRMLSA
jgi:ornithine decarboxylase